MLEEQKPTPEETNQESAAQPTEESKQKPTDPAQTEHAEAIVEEKEEQTPPEPLTTTGPEATTADAETPAAETEAASAQTEHAEAITEEKEEQTPPEPLMTTGPEATTVDTATPAPETEAASAETEHAEAIVEEKEEQTPPEPLMTTGPDEGEPEQPETPAETGQPSPESEAERQEQEKQENIKSELLKTVLATDLDNFDELLAEVKLPELVLLMEELADEEVKRDTIRKVGKIKRAFDKLYSEALDAVKETDVDNPATVKAKEETQEHSNRFTSALGAFNKRKAKYEEELEAERVKNSKIKFDLLDELRQIVHNEDVENYNKVRSIQDRWKNTGQVKGEDVQELTRSYKALLDQYFTLREQYLDLRDQSRKNNLEKKQKLIEQLQSLIPDEPLNKTLDFWKKTVEEVRNLHEEWKKVGPVPRDQSEIVWQLFKTSTDAFYDKRREFFEARDKEREENLQKKQAVLEEIRELARFESDDIEAWREKSKEMQALQDKFKGIGHVPRKKANKLMKAYRNALDDFYDKRSGYFKELDKERDKILERKQKLFDKAEELKDSTDYVQTAEVLKKLQREWKNSGPDDFREARKLQKKFRKACDHFFKRHKAWIGEQEEREKQALEVKEAAIEELQALLKSENPEQQEDTFKEISKRFTEAGPVPLKQRGKIDDKFFNLAKSYLRLSVEDPVELEKAVANLRYKKLQNTPNSKEKLKRERAKLERQLNEAHEKVVQFENNIQFITPGKKGDKLRNEIQGRIDEAAEKRDKIQEKLKNLKKLMREMREAEKKAKEEAKAAAEGSEPASTEETS